MPERRSARLPVFSGVEKVIPPRRRKPTPSRAKRCADCRELIGRGAKRFVEAVGWLCALCLRWRRIDLLAARAT